MKTHLFSHSFPESPVVPAQWLCHFGHYNRPCYLLTLLQKNQSLQHMVIRFKSITKWLGEQK